MTCVIVVGDTHMPRFGRQLPAALVEGLSEADLIVHVGDITEPFVLDLLERHAPTVAVAGNNDPVELVERLGQRRVVTVDGWRLGVTHGHRGPGRTTLDRAVRTFAAEEAVDAVCFGHSHRPLVERRDELWLLNPGSPTDRRRQPTFSYLRIELGTEEIRPQLIRYASRAPG